MSVPNLINIFREEVYKMRSFNPIFRRGVRGITQSVWGAELAQMGLVFEISRVCWWGWRDYL